MNIDLDQLHDFVVVHGFGALTAAGCALGKQLLAEGDDYARLQRKLSHAA